MIYLWQLFLFTFFFFFLFEKKRNICYFTKNMITKVTDATFCHISASLFINLLQYSILLYQKRHNESPKSSTRFMISLGAHILPLLEVTVWVSLNDNPLKSFWIAIGIISCTAQYLVTGIRFPRPNIQSLDRISNLLAFSHNDYNMGVSHNLSYRSRLYKSSAGSIYINFRQTFRRQFPTEIHPVFSHGTCTSRALKSCTKF